MVQVHDSGKVQELVWRILGPILNDSAMLYVADKLETLPGEEKQLCWEILQKVAAHENNCRTYKDTTYNKSFGAKHDSVFVTLIGL